MLPLTIIALILLITGFDPVGNLLGPQAKQTVIIVILAGVALYAVYTSARGK